MKPTPSTIGSDPFIAIHDTFFAGEEESNPDSIERNGQYDLQLKKLLGRVRLGDFSVRMQPQALSGFWQENARAINEILDGIVTTEQDNLLALQQAGEKLNQTADAIAHHITLHQNSRQQIIDFFDANLNQTDVLMQQIHELQKIQTNNQPASELPAQIRQWQRQLMDTLDASQINFEIYSRQTDSEKREYLQKRELYQLQKNLKLLQERFPQDFLADFLPLEVGEKTNEQLLRLTDRLQAMKEHFLASRMLLENSLPNLIDNIQQEAENIKKLSGKISTIPEKF